MKKDDSQFEWRELAEQWRAKNAPPVGLESRLVAEFRRKHATSGQVPNTNYRVWWMAAAAVLAVVFAGLAWNVRQQPQPTIAFTPPQSEVILEIPKVEGVAESKRIAPQYAAVKQRSLAPSKKKANVEIPPVSTVSNRETYTEFFPLEEGPVSIDRGSVVRVRVPRSAMFRVGLPVNMNRINDSIQADLVLSEDGVARAVRFVQ